MKQDFIKQREVINKELWNLKETKDQEVAARIKAEVEPIEQQAKELRRVIQNEFHKKYEAQMEELQNKNSELTGQIENITIGENSKRWYAPGTIVVKWEKKYYSEIYSKKDERGIVAVYDGTQELPENMSHWSAPKRGDIIVQYLKKDGSTGKKFTVISGNYNDTGLNYGAEQWLPEGTDHPKNKK